jgi:4-methyl-5(b-hydroxyethyl)-thiazole monophosphate biosynthesis
MVYIFFAHGFEEIEAVTPLDILRRADITVHSVGISSKTVTGSHGLTVHCDMLDKQITNAKGLEMIVLPGGPGVAALEKSPVVSAYIEHTIKNGLWISAICAAPSILGGKGLLNGKRVTCFPTYADKLGEGAVYTGEPVEVDGKLVTSRGAGTALEFALKLVEVLKGREKAEEIRAAIQM